MDSQNSVSSSYWKIPDSNSYLSAVACHETEPIIAVASGSADSNLFIYELNVSKETRPEKMSNERSVLTHHQTITLPGIHSLTWASPHQRLGRFGNVLASGHKSGLVHLTLLPDPSSSNESAEILRRFNHNHHVKNNNDNLHQKSSNRIKNLSILSNAWSCCAESSVMSLFSENLFLWDPSRSDVPVFRKRSRGALCADPSPLRDGIVSLGGSKGISIMDVRVKDSPGLSPPEENDTIVTNLKWSPHDENHIASVHGQNIIKIWDIRAGKPLVSLDIHSDRVNSIDWSMIDRNEFYTASGDGTIRMWDLQNCIDLQNQALPEKLDKYSHDTPPLRIASGGSGSPPSSSPELDWLPKPLSQYKKRLSRYDDICSHMNYFLESSRDKPPCTTVFSNCKEYLALSPVRVAGSCRVVSVDTDGFFGLHTKHDFSGNSTAMNRVYSSGSEAAESEDDLLSSAGSTISASSSPSHPQAIPDPIPGF